MFTFRNFLTFKIPGIFKIVSGVVVFFVALWLSNMSYEAAEPGEQYIVFRGAIIVSVVWAAFGLFSFWGFIFRVSARKIAFKKAPESEQKIMTQALYEKGLLHGFVSILAADPEMHLEDVSEVMQKLKDKTSGTFTLDSFLKLIKKARRTSKRVSSYFFEIEPWLTPAQKDSIIAECFSVAAIADRDPKRMRVFNSIILGLGLTADTKTENAPPTMKSKVRKQQTSKAKAAAANPPAAASIESQRGQGMEKFNLNPKLKLGLFAVGGLIILILLVKALVGGGSSGPSSAEQAHEARMLALEQERDQHVMRLKQLNNEVEYLINSNPDIVLALGATGIGGSVAMDSEQGGWTRFFAGLAGLVGADYCIQNARACNQFIQEMNIRKEEYNLISNRVSAITLDVGFRMQLTNSCAVPIGINVIFFDQQYDGEVSISNLSPREVSVLKNRHGFYYRTKYDAILFNGQSIDGKYEWKGNQTNEVNGEMLGFQEFKYYLQGNTYGDINFTCNS